MVFPIPSRLSPARPRGVRRVPRLVALAAVVALLAGACGGSVEDTLAEARDRDLSPGERCDAIRDLWFEGEEAVAPLAELARDPSSKVARCAVKALTTIDDPEATDALVALLDDRDPEIAAGAAEALGSIRDPDTVPALVAVLDSRDRAVVTAALQALGWIGEPEAVPAIEKLALRRGATTAADRAGGEVRRAAVFALGEIGDRAARDTLVKVLGTDPAAARAAAYALVKLYRKDVTPLLPLLDDPRNLPLAYALVDKGQSGTEDALVDVLLDHGGLQLAEYYLNCGNRQLERAAYAWAGQHGYSVYQTPGAGGGQWGSGV